MDKSYTRTLTSGLVIFAAILLVAASASFGVYYATTSAAKYGNLAIGAGAFALGLEVLKPFAVHGMFDAFRTRAIGVGFSLLGLAIVAVGYSFTAELSLMATMKGDTTATRSGDVGKRERAQRIYDRAERQLDALGAPVRVASETVAGMPLPPRVATLKRNTVADTDRKRLQAQMREAAEILDAPITVGDADPAAAALGTYLGRFGIETDPKSVADWLTLIAVLALEIGSALSFVAVVHYAPRTAETDRSKVIPKAPVREAVQTSKRTGSKKRSGPTKPKKSGPAKTPAPRGSVTGPLTTPKAGPDRSKTVHRTGNGSPVADRLLEAVRTEGGRVERSRKKWADQLDASKTTINRVVGELAEAGRLTVTGSELRLA